MNVLDIYNLPQEWIQVLDPVPPIKPATGRLKELENRYVDKHRKRGPDELRLCRLFDYFKRIPATENQLNELEKLLWKS